MGLMIETQNKKPKKNNLPMFLVRLTLTASDNLSILCSSIKFIKCFLNVSEINVFLKKRQSCSHIMIEKVRVFHFQMLNSFPLQYGSDSIQFNLLETLSDRKRVQISAHAIHQMLHQFPSVWIYPRSRVEVQRIFLQM